MYQYTVMRFTSVCGFKVENIAPESKREWTGANRALSKLNLNKNLIFTNQIFLKVSFDKKESLEKIIKTLKTDYENQWKKINQINTSIKLSLTLSLNSQNYDLIKKFEKELSNLDLVSNYYIDNFSSQMTIYKIIYNGTPDKFIQEIENNGLKLDTSFGIWRIRWKI